jgi:hypothetical protein
MAMPPQSLTGKNRIAAGSAPAPTRLGPLGHVIDRAEGVRDAVLAAVAHGDEVDVAQNCAAVRASFEIVGQTTRLLDLPGDPVGPLDGPRNDVFEAA